MSEHYTDSSDDDDSSSSSERSSAPTSPHASAGQLGGIIFGGNKAPDKHDESAEKPAQSIWERFADKPEESPLLAALQHADQEKIKNVEDDDDDEEESEEKAPLEKLSPEEEKEVIKDYVATRREELAAEQESASEDDVEAAAIAQLHEKIDEKLEDPEISPEAAVDEAYAETAEAVAASVEENSEETAEEPPEASPDTETAETDPASATPEEEPDEDTTVLPPPVTQPPTPTPPPPPVVPPTPAPYTSPPPPPPPPPPGPVPPFGGGYNVLPTPTPTPNVAPNPNNLTPDDLYAAERRGQIRGVVAGGILGYLLGRRRGRIKTENRLLPVQEKLEEQVEDLHERVAAKELEIRKLAREKAQDTEQTQRQQMAERLRPVPKPELAPHLLAFEPLVPQKAAPELVPIPSAFNPERQKPIPASAVPESLKSVEAPVPAKHIENVERMTNQELLRTSEKVIIDGTSLRTIYEARQITESGLRHILTEFLSGGDIKRALDQELVVKQLTYERDPQLRDGLSAAGYAAASAAGSPQGAAPEVAGVVADQLSSAEGKQALLDAANLPPPYLHHEQSDIPNAALKAARRMERVIVSGWIVFVLALVIVIALLLKHRGGM